jgi:hypothetical protein
VSECLQRVFEGWEQFRPRDEFERQHGSLRRIFGEWEQQFAVLDVGEFRGQINDGVLAEFYTVFSSWRGLTEAVADAQGVINQMNWQQWETARF